MDEFGVSQKKFLSLSKHSQNKYLSNYIKRYYLKSIKNELSLEQLDLLFQKYSKNFLLQAKITKPKCKQEWIEFFSNRFHYHRQQLVQKVTEGDFLASSKNFCHPNESCKQKTHTIGWTVVLDNIRSSFNIGSIFRTVDGVGWKSVLLSGYSSTPNNRHVQKISMNSSNWVDWEYTENLKKWLNSQNLPVIGLETGSNTKDYYNYDWQKAGILILGNEEFGITKDIVKLCQSVVSIPMYGKKNSLNVSNAFAVIAYHVRNKF